MASLPSSNSNERKSLCEESMLLAVNILKFSALSLAGKSLGGGGDRDHPPAAPPPKRLGRAYSGAGRRRAQRAAEVGPRASYVTAPGEAGSDGRIEEYIRRFHQKTEKEVQDATVESEAEDYIKRFYDNIRKDSKNDSNRVAYRVLPPHLQLSSPNFR